MPKRAYTRTIWRPYSDAYYSKLLEKRHFRIEAALSQMHHFPRDIKERILRQSGVLDMPDKGYYVPDYTGQGGFY